jgi:hypothetical protein
MLLVATEQPTKVSDRNRFENQPTGGKAKAACARDVDNRTLLQGAQATLIN